MKRILFLILLVFSFNFSFGQWASVKDSLPKNSNKVLCFSRKPTNPNLYNVFIGYYLKGRWRSDTDTSFFLVTDWMKLPVIPKVPTK